jgi:hypothetical protein
VGPTDGLNAIGNRNISSPYQESNYSPPGPCMFLCDKYSHVIIMYILKQSRLGLSYRGCLNIVLGPKREHVSYRGMEIS